MESKLEIFRQELSLIDDLNTIDEFFLNFDFNDHRELVITMVQVLKQCQTLRQEIIETIEAEIDFRYKALEDRISD